MLSRSAITLRIEAGDRARGRRWDKVREPTGSPDGQKSLHQMAEDFPRAVAQPGGIDNGRARFQSSRL